MAVQCLKWIKVAVCQRIKCVSLGTESTESVFFQNHIYGQFGCFLGESADFQVFLRFVSWNGAELFWGCRANKTNH